MRIQQDIIKSTTTIGEDTKISGANGEKIVRLGIQSAPGTQFYINGSIDNCISVGFTGIYEINFKDLSISVNSIIIAPKVLDQSYDIIVDTIWE